MRGCRVETYDRSSVIFRDLLGSDHQAASRFRESTGREPFQIGERVRACGAPLPLVLAADGAPEQRALGEPGRCRMTDHHVEVGDRVRAVAAGAELATNQ